jgi:hypothetical protein
MPSPRPVVSHTGAYRQTPDSPPASLCSREESDPDSTAVSSAGPTEGSYTGRSTGAHRRRRTSRPRRLRRARGRDRRTQPGPQVERTRRGNVRSSSWLASCPDTKARTRQMPERSRMRGAGQRSRAETRGFRSAEGGARGASAATRAGVRQICRGLVVARRRRRRQAGHHVGAQPFPPPQRLSGVLGFSLSEWVAPPGCAAGCERGSRPSDFAASRALCASSPAAPAASRW